MKTQTELFDETKNLIPSELWSKYLHLTFAEMAKEPELEEWKNELLEAEEEWWSIEG